MIAVALAHSAIFVLTILLILGLGDTDFPGVNRIESALFVVVAILRFSLIWIPEEWWCAVNSSFPPALNPYYIFVAAIELLWDVSDALLSARLPSRRITDRRNTSLTLLCNWQMIWTFFPSLDIILPSATPLSPR